MIHEATRTLVKSPPEVWEQCSDPESLSRHLNGTFGEIRITRLEPENTVAWEGEHGSGTVTIEPSAWGTRVTLTAHTELDKEAEPDLPSPEPAVQAPEEVPTDEAPEEAPESEAPEEVPEPALPEAAWEQEDLEAELEPESPEPPEPAAEEVTPVLTPEPSRQSLIQLILGVWRRRMASDPVPGVDPPPVAWSEPTPPKPAPAPTPTEPAPEPTPLEPEPLEPLEPLEPEAQSPPAEQRVHGSAILMAALESMGQAHHRPYSRG